MSSGLSTCHLHNRCQVRLYIAFAQPLQNPGLKNARLLKWGIAMPKVCRSCGESRGQKKFTNGQWKRDDGICRMCASDSEDGVGAGKSTKPSLRFKVGDTVAANVCGRFADGTVIKLWDGGKAYRIKVHNSAETEVWAPRDDDSFVKSAVEAAAEETPFNLSGACETCHGGAAATAVAAGKRAAASGKRPADHGTAKLVNGCVTPAAEAGKVTVSKQMVLQIASRIPCFCSRSSNVEISAFRELSSVGSFHGAGIQIRGRCTENGHEVFGR